MLGTPRYMSPEQVFTSAAANLDHRSDIYSLGATLYELATGVALFDGPTPLDVLQQIRMADPASPRKVRPAIPRDLEVVLQKCLQKDPKDRYQSADQLAADLRTVREGRPIKARGVPLWTIARRRLQRNHDRVVLAASMIAATIALLVGGFAVWKNHEQSTKGMVRIAAAGGPFAASIYPVDSSGASQPPIMTTTVPMQEPIELEQGEYQIRLASSGRHSELRDSVCLHRS